MRRALLNTAMREYLRGAFSEHRTFIFEHLHDGYFRVQVDTAQLKSSCGDTPEQNKEIAEILIARLKEALKVPSSPRYKLMEELNDNMCACADVAELEAFKTAFDAHFGKEECEAAREEMKNTLANRKWLRDNHKTLETTAQTRKFHELANTYRLDGNLDEWDFMNEAYAGAVR